jgi:hypothetical protein
VARGAARPHPSSRAAADRLALRVDRGGRGGDEILTGDAESGEPAERPAGEVLLARIRLRARDI